MQHLYHSLDMGLVKQCSRIIPKSELQEWTDKGWIEDRDFEDFNYYPEDDETMLLSKPPTLAETGPDILLNRTILDFSFNQGTYGMGGPGFFGLLIDRDGSREYLTYTVWASGQYVLMDGRVLECHLNHNESYHPWFSDWSGENDENRWDDLSGVLKGSVIISSELTDTELHLDIASHGNTHRMTFYRYHADLPPQGDGGLRKPAFEEGKIGSYLILCDEYAVLHI